MNNARTILTIAVVGLLVLILLAIFTGGGMMGGGMMGGGMVGLLFTLLFWGLVIALIAAVVVLIVGRR